MTLTLALGTAARQGDLVSTNPNPNPDPSPSPSPSPSPNPNPNPNPNQVTRGVKHIVRSDVLYMLPGAEQLSDGDRDEL